MLMWIAVVYFTLFQIQACRANQALKDEISSLSYANQCSESSYALSEPHEKCIWNEKSNYYFKDVNFKLTLTLSKECLTHVEHTHTSVVSLPENERGIKVASFPPSSIISNWWLNLPRPRNMRVEPYLCEAVYEKKRPIFFNKGCQLPHYMNPSAPRCQTKYLKWICEKSSRSITESNISSQHAAFVLPESDHLKTFYPPIPWLLTFRRAIVSLCGTVLTSCGIVHTTANCMATGNKFVATKFQSSCRLFNYSGNYSLSADQLSLICKPGTPYSSSVTYVQRVFVVAEVDDSYVYHLHLEIIPRILYHLQFLQDNPSVLILIGCDSRPSKELTEAGLKHMLLSIKPLMELSGLSMSRLLVHQHVYAEEVYFPMEGACQDPIYNTWQILNMRQFYMQKIDPSGAILDPFAINHRGTGHVFRGTILLMKRSVGAKHTRNNQDSVRQWSDSFTELILQELRIKFEHSFKIKLFSDRNTTMMKCHACQIKEFYEADVLIGVHGAGLANMLYMKPNSAVVEFAPYGNDGRCLLGGGPFSRLAALMSHNYMIHHPPYKEYKWMPDKTCEFNITRFIVHIHSFLKSIEFM